MSLIRCLVTVAILWSICCNLILVEKLRHVFPQSLKIKTNLPHLFSFTQGFFSLCVGLLVRVCFFGFFFAQEMSCYLGTAVCKGNICDQSPHQLQSYYSFSWAFEQEFAVPIFLSAMLLAVLQCLTFSVLEPLWEKFTAIWSARVLLILSLIVMSVL